MRVNNLKLFLCLTILTTNILSIDFFFTLDGYSHKCLGEYLTEHTTGINLLI